jgi:hypothetical protein
MWLDVRSRAELAAHQWLRFLFSVGIRRPQIEDDAAPEYRGTIDVPDDLSGRWMSMLEVDTSPLAA